MQSFVIKTKASSCTIKTQKQRLFVFGLKRLLAGDFNAHHLNGGTPRRTATGGSRDGAPNFDKRPHLPDAPRTTRESEGLYPGTDLGGPQPGGRLAVRTGPYGIRPLPIWLPLPTGSGAGWTRSTRVIDFRKAVAVWKDAVPVTAKLQSVAQATARES